MLMLGERPFQIQVSSIAFDPHFNLGQIQEWFTPLTALFKKSFNVGYQKYYSFLYYIRGEKWSQSVENKYLHKLNHENWTTATAISLKNDSSNNVNTSNSSQRVSSLD